MRVNLDQAVSHAALAGFLGSPSTRPAGTDVAGWPVTSNGAVFPIISSARVM